MARASRYGALAEEIATEIGCTVLASDTLPTGDPSVLPPPPGPERVRRWLYHTSGSTSDPKGAWHADASVMAGMYAFVTRIKPTPDDVYPICFPVSHIGGANMLAAALHVGYLLPLVEAFDAERTPLFMAEQGATLLGTALPMFQAYLAAERKHGDEPLFPRLRTCVGGGAPKPPGIDEVIRRELGGLGVVSSWGLTEFPTATSASVDDTLEQIETTEGRASPGVEIRVVSIDGKECGPGEEGELRLRGPHLFLGYANPALDADALDEQGYFRTGDLGIVADTGHVTITGRLKDIIIRNAENIAASEIEDAPAPAPGHRRRRGDRSPRSAHRRARVRGGGAGRRRDVALARRDRRALPRARPRQAEGARAARDRRRGPPQRDGQDPEARPPQAVRPR